MQTKKVFWGELALLIGITVLSMGITLMIKSNFGITPIASLPYVLSKIITTISFGTWNYLLQILTIILLVLLTKNIKTGYYLSFFLVIGYGYVLDLFEYLATYLPVSLPLQLIYYAVGFVLVAYGVCMLIISCMPILPFDTFIRDISNYFSFQLKYVKTCFDISCLLFSIIFGMIFLGGIEGIGMGTFISALFTGKFVAIFSKQLNKYYSFRPVIKILGDIS